MAGPDNQQTKQFIIPFGEATANYTPNELASKIINFEATVEATLATVRGPTLYEPPRTGQGATVFGEMHGIFHANLMGGTSDTLLVRAGQYLYRHAGWQRGWQLLYSGLTSDTRPNYPDQFLVLNDKIIWTNGIDYPLIIDGHGSTHPLGISQIPSAPSVYGPQSVPGKSSFYPNAGGYSWCGEIGTPGDVLSGVQGALLDGAWFYYVQLEDIYGNLSAPSPPSNAAIVKTQQANPLAPATGLTVTGSAATLADSGTQTGAEIDDLTRQFMVRLTGQGPSHTVAVNLYRTPDTVRGSTKPRLLARLSGRERMVFGDRSADNHLGAEMEPTVAMTVFRTMCAHRGCLIIANTPSDPGIVRRSAPGFPGTLPKDEYVYPDTGGAEVTAVASHAGYLLAFTETAVYDISDFAAPALLAQGIGCVAPRSIKALADGRLVWLARDGFYSMDPGRRIARVSNPIHATLRSDLNTTRFRKAVAALDPRSLEYRCAIPPAGETRNTRVMVFDGSYWRQIELGISIADICQTDDYRQYLLFAGRRPATLADPQQHAVFVMDRETSNFEPPARTAVYRSGWIYADATGMTPVHIRSLYLGMIDAFDGTFTIRFYRNGSWKPVVEMTDVLAIGVDDESGVVTDIAGAAVVGTAKAHDPRLFWRMVPVGLENAYGWAFEIEVTYPTRLELAAFAFDQSAASAGNLRGRVPLRADR
jgi:hypothetical protein